jgi:hypothetical protein
MLYLDSFGLLISVALTSLSFVLSLSKTTLSLHLLLTSSLFLCPFISFSLSSPLLRLETTGVFAGLFCGQPETPSYRY